MDAVVEKKNGYFENSVLYWGVVDMPWMQM